MKHADPNGEQFKTLQRILVRWVSGEVSKAESYWRQQLALKPDTVVATKEWKAALLHIRVWCGFMSIAQMGARGTAADIADLAGSSALTEAQRKVATDLKRAATSLPAYIGRTTQLLVTRCDPTPSWRRPFQLHRL